MTGDESFKDGRSMWVCHRSMCRGVGSMGCWFHVGNSHPIQPGRLLLVFLVVFSRALPQQDTSFCSMLLKKNPSCLYFCMYHSHDMH